MKNRFLTYTAILLTISPVTLAFVWHINNHGWPNDDAANYTLTAYQQYLAFCDGSLFDGIQAMYQVRGWRPILFPVLATPFLWLFNGSVLAATSATLLLCFIVCQVYVFAIARRYLDPIRAAFVAAFVGSSQAIAAHSTIFFAEMAWLAFFTGFVFHLLESDKFRRARQASIAGFFLGLAALIRPAETLAIASIPLIGMVLISCAVKDLSISSAARVAGFVLFGALLLFASIFLKQEDYRLVLGVGVFISLAQLLLIKAHKTEHQGFAGLNLFAIVFMVINMFWWANSMPQLYSWIYDTSFGTMAQVTDVSVYKEEVFTVLKNIFSKYLFPQGVLVGAMCLLLLLPSPRGALGNIKKLFLLAMITCGLLVPMCALYAATGTSDPRRVFVGMAFLLTLLSVLSLQEGPLRRFRDVGFVFIVALQLYGLLWSAKGESLKLDNLGILRVDIPMPKMKADKNEALIFRLLELGVPKSSTVAVYTIALFQAHDRIYEPAALQLASLTTGSKLNIIYYWDTSDYSAVINRLKRDSAKFLLLDKYRNPNSASMHQPSAKFAATLLDKLETSRSDPQGLRQVASFKMEGREQVLFEIL